MHMRIPSPDLSCPRSGKLTVACCRALPGESNNLTCLQMNSGGESSPHTRLLARSHIVRLGCASGPPRYRSGDPSRQLLHAAEPGCRVRF